MNTTASVAGPAGRIPYPGALKAVLIVDIVLCALLAITLGIGFTLVMLGGADGPSSSQALREVILGGGIVIFGLSGNTLLLMRRRAGVWLGAIALLLVLVFLAAGSVDMWQAAMHPDPESCPPETVIIGFIFGSTIRLSFNFLYALGLGKAHSLLRANAR